MNDISHIHSSSDDDTVEAAASSASHECEQSAGYLAGWKRCQADYANLKKETEREKAAFSKYANEHLLLLLLPAIEQFETALFHVPDLSGLSESARKPLENWLAGIQAVKAIWENTFQAIGLEQIIPTDEFDPLVHEAVAREPSDTMPDGHVLRLIRAGWRLNGKLLRPAQVVISQHAQHENTPKINHTI